MNSQLSKHPHNRETSNEHDKWTVLVRVGEDEWRIGNVPEEPASEQPSSPSGGNPQYGDWRRAAKRYRRRARFQVYRPTVKSAWQTAVRAQVQRWLDLCVDLLDPLLNLSGHRERAGGESYRSQTRLRHTSPLARSGSHEQASARQRRFRDSLELGAVVGLVLGCLSLVLFHQMTPVSASEVSPHVYQNSVQSPSVGSLSVTLPALRLNVLQVGPFQTDAKAQTAATELGKKGHWAISEKSGRGIFLVAGAALYSSKLQPLEETLRKLHYPVTVTSIQVPAQKVSAASGANSSDMHQISGWLDAAVSSLNSMTGVLADGEAVRDADTSYSAARAKVPSPAMLKESGMSTQLSNFERHWETAYAALNKHQDAKAMQETVQAYFILIGLRQGG